MARRPRTEPTDVELELLNHLWESGPCELGQLCAAVRKTRPVATTTVATMLGVMREKGWVKRARSPKGYLWSARVERAATRKRLLAGLVDRVFDGSAALLVAHLLEDRRLSEEDLRQIRHALEKAPGESDS